MRPHHARTPLVLAAAAALLAACGGSASTVSDDDLAPVTAGASASPDASPSASPDASASASADPTTSPGDDASPTQGASSGPGSRTVVDASAELEVEDQRGDGTGVRVDEARLSVGNGHVAVYDRAGALLGSAPVTAGSQPVTIPLDVPVTASTELLVVLHADDGDGAFDPETDPVVLDDDGDREDEDVDYVVG